MVRTYVMAALPLAVLTASPLAAQWLPVPVPASPPARSNAVLTPWQNGELLLLGGDAANPAATEWSWNGIRWAPVTTPIPRRNLPAVARNESDGSVLLCGGVSALGVPLTDTWRFAAGSWTQLFPATVPTGQPMLMAHEPGTGNMILLASNQGTNYGTWRFTNGNWVQVNSFSLVSSAPATLLSDTVRNEVCMVVLGAAALGVQRLAASAWVEVAQISSTPPPEPTWAAFDTDRGRAVIVQTRLPATLETFVYDGLHLVAMPAATIPYAGLNGGSLAYHAERREPVFVGRSTTTMNTWRWVEQPVPMANAYDASCVPGLQLALAPGDSPQPGGLHRLVASGANTSSLTLSALGLSHVQFGALPLPLSIPLGSLGCQLRVEPLLIDLLGVGLPAQKLVALPNTSTLLGVRYDAQALQLDGSGVTNSSNGLEVQIGEPLPQNVLLETFVSNANRDALASGDGWSNGSVTPVAIGGDGRHGSFDPAFGTSLGNGVYQWNTDNTTIPAGNTLDGVATQVTDGRFFFTDFVVPAGVTVRFVGASAAQIHVRGKVDVRGTVSVDAADMPFQVPTTGPSAGQRVSTFNARGLPASSQVFEQQGGAGGAGGGRGGNGGRECLGFGPILVAGINVTDGQPGQDVQVGAGHAYAAATVGTGGAGSPLHPATGLTASAGAPFIVATLSYRDEFSRGGGGGGFMLPGGAPAVPTIPAPAFTQPNSGPAVAGGAAFPLLPFPSNPPSGYSSLQHYLVGGSGGGGGGSHSFGSVSIFTDAFMAGHGGSGGGGALALRAGADVVVLGSVTSRGGAGVLINGDNPVTSTQDVDLGVSSPGGGGSGGSVVLQSAGAVTVNGAIDTSGGAGSRTANVAVFSLAPTQLNVQSQAGAGSSGFYRLESSVGVTVTGTTVPAYNPATQSGPLADQDARTGSRSTWLLPAAAGLPYYLRYELVVDIGGTPVLFSDDPAVSPLAANQPNGPVVLRLQGAQVDPVSGSVVANTVGPWRTRAATGAGSLNSDRAQALRFDLVLDKSQGVTAVRELRLIWR